MVAKLQPSKIAVYAMALPYAVLKEWAETMVSRGVMTCEFGRSARVAETPAVMFSCVNWAPWTWPDADLKNETVKTSPTPMWRTRKY